MTGMDYRILSRRCVAILLAAGLLAALRGPAPARAQCSQEVTAVLLLSGIHPGTDLRVERLTVARRGAVTDPSAAQLLAAVTGAYFNSIYAHNAPALHHALAGTAGHFALYAAPPSDFGAATFIDQETGEIAFAGAMWFAGEGTVVLPAAGTHACTIVSGPPAAAPDQSVALPNDLWHDTNGTADELLRRGLAFAAHTDFLHSMADCGAYSVVGYVYTPAVGATVPNLALEVLIFSGRIDPLWVPVATSAESWGRVKALYR